MLKKTPFVLLSANRVHEEKTPESKNNKDQEVDNAASKEEGELEKKPVEEAIFFFPENLSKAARNKTKQLLTSYLDARNFGDPKLSTEETTSIRFERTYGPLLQEDPIFFEDDGLSMESANDNLKVVKTKVFWRNKLYTLVFLKIPELLNNNGLDKAYTLLKKNREKLQLGIYDNETESVMPLASILLDIALKKGIIKKLADTSTIRLELDLTKAQNYFKLMRLFRKAVGVDENATHSEDQGINSYYKLSWVHKKVGDTLGLIFTREVETCARTCDTWTETWLLWSNKDIVYMDIGSPVIATLLENLSKHQFTFKISYKNIKVQRITTEPLSFPDVTENNDAKMDLLDTDSYLLAKNE
ncbi:MAG: hypothetical protein D6767_06250 [Candidatus Hydrogenedentota bacterium]|nr:MAG: hypothetical protein D6767_06250 [Candidatus Hydrogenedentota bacterium]